MISRKTGFVTGISKLKRNNGNTDSDLDRKKKRFACALFFSFARPMQIRRENGGCEEGGRIGPRVTHDRSRVGRGINMKSCRLIYDPGGRCLIYDATPSPPGKRRLYFLSACDASLHGANRRSNSPFPFFFSFFSKPDLRYSLARFIQLSNVGKGRFVFDYFYPSRRLQIDEISRDISSFAKYLLFPTCGGEEEEIQFAT